MFGIAGLPGVFADGVVQSLLLMLAYPPTLD
jgi:hypothetical protein